MTRLRYEKAQTDEKAARAFWMAEFCADAKSNLECVAEFWGVWRSEFLKEKIAQYLFEIKNHEAVIDKLRKNRRIKTKSTLEAMKRIQNRVIKERYFAELKEYCNYQMAKAQVEKQQKEIKWLNGEVGKERALGVVDVG